ncbi:hypothetical protein [Flavobacterium sp. ASV13]|uniref:hypothetical protein n=1 Tax=Flavobacterium sp. ASV13 TaxID=1506583 RepID=UPI000556E1EA|nr:hypothetical protein [Flavobacterium sp. ASV13]
MKKTKKTKIEEISKEKKKWKIFYYFIFILGITLLFFEILIFRKTLVSVYVPIFIILIVGFLAFYLSKKHLKEIYPISSNFILIVQNLGSWGFISCYLFMAANYYLSDTITKEFKTVIKEKSSMPGPKGSRDKRDPLVRFNYFGSEKELVFKFKETEKVNSADSVKVIIKKGGVGFDVLESYDVF